MLSPELLKTFIVFVEAPNIVAAAKSLGLSQPAVTHQLKSLETRIGKSLFSMQGKKKVLNALGKSLYEDVEPIFKQLDYKLAKFDRMMSNLSSLELKLGGRRELLQELAPKLEYPGRLTLISMSGPQALEQLKNHQIDLAIHYDPAPLPGLMQKFIKSDKFHFLVHKKWLGKRKTTISLFRDRNFLTNTPCLSYRQPAPHIHEWCRIVDMNPSDLDIRFTVDDWPTVVKLVEQGRGWCLCPSTFESQDADVVRIAIPTKDLPAISIYLLYFEDLRPIVQLMKF